MWKKKRRNANKFGPIQLVTIIRVICRSNTEKKGALTSEWNARKKQIANGVHGKRGKYEVKMRFQRESKLLDNEINWTYDWTLNNGADSIPRTVRQQNTSGTQRMYWENSIRAEVQAQHNSCDGHFRCLFFSPQPSLSRIGIVGFSISWRHTEFNSKPSRHQRMCTPLP